MKMAMLFQMKDSQSQSLQQILEIHLNGHLYAIRPAKSWEKQPWTAFAQDVELQTAATWSQRCGLYVLIRYDVTIQGLVDRKHER